MNKSNIVSQSSVDVPKAKTRNPVLLLFLAGLLLIALWLGLKGWRTAQAAQSLLARQAEAEALMADGLTNIDPDAAEALVYGIRRDVLVIKNEVTPFMPLTPYLGWLPKIGPVVVAAPELLEMADAGTETAVYGFQGLKPALVLMQQEEASSERISELVSILDSAEPELRQASAALERVAAARANIDNVEAFPWRLRTLFAQADVWLPRGQDSLKAALVLPEIMGSDGLRRYLVIAQNEDEIRPTGGYISGGGLLVVENGRIVDLTFQSAFDVEDWSKPYDAPPQPYYDLMGLELFVFRDANFWPDFPTSAQVAMELYSYGQDTPPLDGAIAFDQRFAQYLLQATGPVYVAESDITINHNNVIESFQAAWAAEEGETTREWINQRKAFLGPFAGAIRNKIENNFAALDPIALLQNIFEAIETKHLQIYMRDPEVAATLEELNWDGRLPAASNQDFLMVVDTNMGFNKANRYVEKRIDYHVSLANDGHHQATLALEYTHSAADNGEPCYQDINYSGNPTYLELADRCYWNYLRIYTPSGSRLISATRHTVPGKTFVNSTGWDRPAAVVDDPSPLTTFANFFMLPRQETINSTYLYHLPDTVTQATAEAKQYTVTISKQAGVEAQPLHVTVTLPENSEYISATPVPTAIDGRNLIFETRLDRDKTFSVTYRQ